MNNYNRNYPDNVLGKFSNKAHLHRVVYYSVYIHVWQIYSVDLSDMYIHALLRLAEYQSSNLWQSFMEYYTMKSESVRLSRLNKSLKVPHLIFKLHSSVCLGNLLIVTLFFAWIHHYSGIITKSCTLLHKCSQEKNGKQRTCHVKMTPENLGVRIMCAAITNVSQSDFFQMWHSWFLVWV